jgi:hypothetical protein
MFHPELAERCEGAFRALLQKAQGLQPQVWLARLSDISSWWAEKASFSAAAAVVPGGWHITFSASPRATILVKDLGAGLEGSRNAVEPWWGLYARVRSPVLDVDGEALPFLGLPADSPPSTVAFLREQGYIVRTDELGERCAIYLDRETLASVQSDVGLIDRIENCPGPLVRFWRWPDGARSTLSITGDLDALSLVDYAPRLWAH